MPEEQNKEKQEEVKGEEKKEETKEPEKKEEKSAESGDKIQGDISVAEDEEKPKSPLKEFVHRNKLLIVLVGSILLAVAVTVGILLYINRDVEVDFSGGVKGNKWMGAVVSFDVTALLAEDDENAMKNLEAEIFLELDNDDAIEEVVDKKNMLNDIFLGMLAEKRADEIDSLSEQRRLKVRIQELSNAYLYTGKVKRVYFTRFKIVANEYMVQGDAP